MTMLNATDSQALGRLIVCYMNVTSIKMFMLKWKKNVFKDRGGLNK